MVTYSTNWMGPINKKWIEEHGDCWSAGRIDIRDSSKEGYDGWDEYAIAPMHNDDWSLFSTFLQSLQTREKLPYEYLIHEFEQSYGRTIRWAK